MVDDKEWCEGPFRQDMSVRKLFMKKYKHSRPIRRRLNGREKNPIDESSSTDEEDSDSSSTSSSSTSSSDDESTDDEGDKEVNTNDGSDKQEKDESSSVAVDNRNPSSCVEAAPLLRRWREDFRRGRRLVQLRYCKKVD
jgi:hypothetical protein